MKKTNKIQSLRLGVLCAFALILAGCAETVIVPPNPVTGEPAKTNYVANHYVTQGAQVVQTVSPFLPPPYGTIVGGIAVLVAAAAGGIAAYQNKKKNENASMLAATIAGVETAGTPATKKAIQDIAAGAGVQDKLNAVVQQVTGNMTGPEK